MTEERSATVESQASAVVSKMIYRDEALIVTVVGF